jgi:hypothetical protein
MADQEGLALQYKKLMEESSTPGYIITIFYSLLFNITTDQKTIAMISNLVKIYGREVVFYSVLDMVEMENLDHSSIVRLLSYFCKKRLSQDKESKYTDLSKELNKLKDIEIKLRAKPVKIKDPFEEKES